MFSIEEQKYYKFRNDISIIHVEKDVLEYSRKKGNKTNSKT